jgi:CheY-like chemotaxis protein/HPt (histidine-containing phosphotransfer) domain-containing protein
VGGKIYVQSEENKGSRFYFTIKLESIEEVPKPIIKRQPLRLEHKNKSYRILVVEDNQINQKVALCMLKSMGYQAVAVGNGLEALESLSQVPYDLVLMDCQMPVLDGYETTRRIRGNLTLPFHQIPIVAMTANAIIGEREKCISCGMSDYISKPVDSNNLAKVIKKWLADSDLDSGTVDYSAWDTLRQMPSQNHENLLAEIIKMFEKEVTLKPAAMKILAKKKDLTQLKKDAHTFKTSCANLGFRKLQKLCLQIENLESQDWRVAEELIEGVSSECEVALKIMAEDRKANRLNAS